MSVCVVSGSSVYTRGDCDDTEDDVVDGRNIDGGLQRLDDELAVKPVAGDEQPDKLKLIGVLLSLPHVFADVCRRHPALTGVVQPGIDT